MADVPTFAENSNVIPVWGLMPDECRYIRARADELISQSIASRVYEKRNCAYMCVFDNYGSPYTIGREQRYLHLLDSSGTLITIGENLDAIMGMLAASLQQNNLGAIEGSE